MQGVRAFLDTNIFAYAFDRRDLRKHQIAVDLIVDLLRNQKGVIILQIAHEFLNVAFRATVPGLTPHQGRRYLRDVVSQLELHEPTLRTVEKALELKPRYLNSWFDSLIVAAAVESGCKFLYTEDFNHGQVIEGMTIVNPFA